MNGEELIALFKECIGDENFDETSAYIFLNTAKTKIELKREWEMLKAVDESNNTTGNYTNTYSLPADFLMPLEIDCIFVNDNVPYNVLRPEKWRQYYTSGEYAKFDIANDYFYLSGTPQSGQRITLNYIKKTDTIDATTEVGWTLEDWHPLVAYEAAELYYIAEGVEPSSNMAFAWRSAKEAIYQSMVDYDIRLKIAYQNNYNDVQ